MNPIIVIPIGLPASGKTSLFKMEYPYFKHISPDNIRFSILDYPNSGIDFDESIEPTVWKIVWNKLEKAVEKKQNIYFDCTNVSLERRNKIYDILTEDYNVQLKVFTKSIEACIRVDSLRKRTVGEEVIRTIHSKFDFPRISELKKFKFCGITPVDFPLMKSIKSKLYISEAIETNEKIEDE